MKLGEALTYRKDLASQITQARADLKTAFRYNVRLTDDKPYEPDAPEVANTNLQAVLSLQDRMRRLASSHHLY